MSAVSPQATPPPAAVPPPHVAPAATPNAIHATGPGSSSFQEWERNERVRIADEQRELARVRAAQEAQQREADERRAMLDSDSLYVIAPAVQRALAERAVPADRRAAWQRDGAQIGGVVGGAGAVYIARARPWLEVAFFGTVGWMLGATGGMVLGGIAERATAPSARLPPELPADVERSLRERLPQPLPQWRVEGLRAAWASQVKALEAGRPDPLAAMGTVATVVAALRK